jgi:Bacillus/Clostridium GerA spore germination protein.
MTSGILDASQDIIVREFSFGCGNKTEGALIYIDGMVDMDIIDSSVMNPLMYDTCLIPKMEANAMSDIDAIQKNCFRQVNNS